jgi:hypothetical protein
VDGLAVMGKGPSREARKDLFLANTVVMRQLTRFQDWQNPPPKALDHVLFRANRFPPRIKCAHASRETAAAFQFVIDSV